MQPYSVPVDPVDARTQRSGWGLRLAFLGILLGLVGAGSVVAGLVALTLWTLTEADVQPVDASPAIPMTSETAATPEPGPDVWDRHGPINVLLIGVDQGITDGCQESNYRLSDTLILVRFDRQTKRAGLMSIPRDLFVMVPQYGARKITTAHAIGENRSPGGGPALVARTVQTNLELPVHRTIRVDVQGFERIIDALGGVDIDVPASESDPSVGLYDAEYPDGRCGIMEVSIPPGRQHFDGVTALQYARSRKSTSDFDRSRRQVDVLLALRERALGLEAVLNMPTLLPAVLDTVATDLTPREILSLARSAADVDVHAIDRYPLDYEVVTDGWVVADGVNQSVLRLIPGPYSQLRRRFLDLAGPEPTPTPESGGLTETAGLEPRP